MLGKELKSQRYLKSNTEPRSYPPRFRSAHLRQMKKYHPIFNMSPEKGPLKKGISLPTIIFEGTCHF